MQTNVLTEGTIETQTPNGIEIRQRKNAIDLLDNLRQAATFRDATWDSMTAEQKRPYHNDKFYAHDKLQRAELYLRKC